MPDWRINESVRLIRPIFTIKKVVIFAPNESPALTIYSAVDRNVAATVQIRGGIKRIVIKTARIYELHYETCAKHFFEFRNPLASPARLQAQKHETNQIRFFMFGQTRAASVSTFLGEEHR